MPALRPSSRREFFKSATVGTAALAMTARSYARVAGANDRIRVGQIGCGNREILLWLRRMIAERHSRRRCAGLRRIDRVSTTALPPLSRMPVGFAARWTRPHQP